MFASINIFRVFFLTILSAYVLASCGAPQNRNHVSEWIKKSGPAVLACSRIENPSAQLVNFDLPICPMRKGYTQNYPVKVEFEDQPQLNGTVYSTCRRREYNPKRPEETWPVIILQKCVIRDNKAEISSALKANVFRSMWNCGLVLVDKVRDSDQYPAAGYLLNHSINQDIDENTSYDIEMAVRLQSFDPGKSTEINWEKGRGRFHITGTKFQRVICKLKGYTPVSVTVKPLGKISELEKLRLEHEQFFRVSYSYKPGRTQAIFPWAFIDTPIWMPRAKLKELARQIFDK